MPRGGQLLALQHREGAEREASGRLAGLPAKEYRTTRKDQTGGLVIEWLVARGHKTRRFKVLEGEVVQSEVVMKRSRQLDRGRPRDPNPNPLSQIYQDPDQLRPILLLRALLRAHRCKH